MKYALITIGALVLAALLSFFIVLLIHKRFHLRLYARIIIGFFGAAAFSVLFALAYFAFNYRATDAAREYLKNDDDVTLKESGDYIEFDYASSDARAVIFYCGAKVDPIAYAPLCNKVAHLGVDVYLIKSPLYFPLLSLNAADKIAGAGTYQDLYMMGHSLGGTTASLYLSNTQHTYKGIILLASYSTKKLDDSLKCLSIYGSNDTVINKDAYQQNLMNLPKGYKEVVIDGGNHSGFGEYGPQRGDGEATISKQDQIAITVNSISAMLSIS